MDIPLRRPSAPLRASRALLVLALLVGACSGGANPGGTGSVPGSATSSVPAATPPGASAGTGSPGASGATGPSCGPDAASYPGWPSGPPQTPPEIIPILVSQDVSVGRNRFLMTLIDQQNELVASPDLAVTLRFFDLAADPATPRVEVPGSFLSLSGDERGLYRAGVDFACAGTWGVEVVARGGGRPDRTARAVFSVRPSSATPAIGAPAPSSETPTAANAEEIRRISTDSEPDPDFYRLSVADALAARRPFLLAFSTPAFCKTRTCGPALEVVKQVAPAFKDRVNFVHVEPYQLTFQNGQLQPVLDAQGVFETVPATDEWRLPTEPYLFVVDGDGVVRAKFEGGGGADELTEALEAVAG